MLEAGLQALVQGNSAVAAIATAGGGYGVALPKGQALPSWSYVWVSETGTKTLAGKDGLTKAWIQLDCFGANMAGAIGLAHAIDAVLDDYSGTLGDSDSTRVFSTTRINKLDFFDDNARTYRRVLEYEIWYAAK